MQYINYIYIFYTSIKLLHVNWNLKQLQLISNLCCVNVKILQNSQEYIQHSEIPLKGWAEFELPNSHNSKGLMQWGLYHACFSLQCWVFLLSWPESRAATHNEARLLGQKSIPPRNGNQEALIAVLGPYRCPGYSSRSQLSGKLSRNQDWGKNTPDWKSPPEWSQRYHPIKHRVARML